jgi:hypothetical protein
MLAARFNTKSVPIHYRKFVGLWIWPLWRIKVNIIDEKALFLGEM